MRTVSRARRWALSMLFVLVGTAGATSFGLLGWVAGMAVGVPTEWRVGVAAGVTLALALLLGLLRPTRRTEIVLAETLLDARFPDDWPLGRVERVRGGVWFAGHVLAGAVAFPAGLLGLFTGLGLLVAPWTHPDGARPLEIGALPTVGQGTDWVIVLAGAAVLSLTGALATVLPRVTRWAAEVMLGPSPREMLALAEAQAARAAERNRVARDLHDSVGHDLSLISILATAAVRTAADEPRQRYLHDIQSAARAALTNLDNTLGILRDETSHWRETLANLDELLTRFHTAGLTVDLSTAGALADLPHPASREGYRIVAEALTNAGRHGADRSAALAVEFRDETLLIECANAVRRRRSRTAGRGLVGIRERATLLGGSVTHGETDGRWLLRVRVPVRR